MVPKISGVNYERREYCDSNHSSSSFPHPRPMYTHLTVRFIFKFSVSYSFFKYNPFFHFSSRIAVLFQELLDIASPLRYN